MKYKLIFSIFFCGYFLICAAQDNNALFSRLQAISNSGITFYNVDGIEITNQILNGEFSKKNISKQFRRHGIKEKDLVQSDSTIAFQNFYITKTETTAPGLQQNTSYYFIEVPTVGIRAVTFGRYNQTDKQIERDFIQLLIYNNIPPHIYHSPEIDTINFAGRKITVDNRCRWMGINNLQCPSFGQMNWSIHKTLDDAVASADNQYKMIQAKKQGKVISEDTVKVIFEGSEVNAKKLVYDFKGISSVLVGMSGGKTLTVYIVAAPVRENFVSCVMSFWNNDVITSDGLAPLLEEVMKLKK